MKEKTEKKQHRIRALGKGFGEGGGDKMREGGKEPKRLFLLCKLIVWLEEERARYKRIRECCHLVYTVIQLQESGDFYRRK